MNTKKSFFEFSSDLIRDDLKRFWHIPAIAFLALFCLGGIPLFQLNGKSRFLTGTDIFQLGANSAFSILQALLLAAVSVLMAAGVFSFLHGKDSAAAIHSLPFTRKMLFRSHTLAGWVLAVSPVILSTLSFAAVFAFQTAQREAVVIFCGNPASWQELCLEWFLAGMITVTLTYCISVLAAVISGNTFTHILLALFLNGALPVLVNLCNVYMRYFLKGLTTPPIATTWFSPYLQFYLNYGGSLTLDSSLHWISFYLASSILILLLSGFLYRKIRLEREGDSVVFRPFGEIVCCLFAFIGMSLFGFFSYTVLYLRSIPVFLLFGLIGSLLFYLTARMVLEKGFQVFHCRALKGYGVFLLAAAVFCSLTIFDITGFEKRIPEADDIRTVSIEGGVSVNPSEGAFIENIRGAETEVRALHAALIEESSEPEDPDTYNINTRLVLSYRLKNGREIDRTYHFNLHNLGEARRCYETLYNADAYRRTLVHSAKNRLQELQTIDSMGLIDESDQLQFLTVRRSHDTFLRELKKALIKDAGRTTFAQALKIAEVDRIASWYVYYTDSYGTDRMYPIYPWNENALAVIAKYRSDLADLHP